MNKNDEVWAEMKRASINKGLGGQTMMPATRIVQSRKVEGKRNRCEHGGSLKKECLEVLKNGNGLVVCKEVDQGVVEDRINAKRVVDEVLSGDVEDGVGVVEVMENGDVMSSTMLVGSTNVKLPKKRLNDDVVEEMQVREQLINVKGVVEENVFVDLAKEKEKATIAGICSPMLDTVMKRWLGLKRAIQE